jgi:hypothetical protein
MFVKSFVLSFKGAAQARRPQAVALRLAEWPARVHWLVTPTAERASAMVDAERGYVARIRAAAIARLRRAAQSAARTALRTAYVGGPLTPTGYVVLALTVGAIAMVAMLCASSAGNEMEGALRVNAWFA